MVRGRECRGARGLEMPSEGIKEDYLNEDKNCDGDYRTRGYSKIEQHFGRKRKSQ